MRDFVMHNNGGRYFEVKVTCDSHETVANLISPVLMRSRPRVSRVA
jgi:hypothetical protein